MIINNIEFKKTEDNSVGLFDKNVNDILHSNTGALKEAYDKFIIPCRLKELSQIKSSINILDICYGVGYNTKAALNSISDCKINIDALEINKELIYLSPFIYDNIECIELKIFIIEQILNNYELRDEFLNYILKIKEDGEREFFCPFIRQFKEAILNDGYINYPEDIRNRFLHNIYYNYISSNNKINFKSNIYNKCTIDFHVDDARASVNKLNKIYDVVFLDAYSPQIDPTLWTIDFLSLIKDKMNKYSILVSYSKSTPFRSALIKLGFFVGKTYIDNIDMGTVASLTANNIQNNLNNFDLGLLNTRSSIPYKDPHLNLSAKEIIYNRKIESDNSNLQSHTSFLKSYFK